MGRGNKQKKRNRKRIRDEKRVKRRSGRREKGEGGRYGVRGVARIGRKRGEGMGEAWVREVDRKRGNGRRTGDERKGNEGGDRTGKRKGNGAERQRLYCLLHLGENVFFKVSETFFF